MKDFCYHGIGTNLIRYESILKLGILTKKTGAYEVNPILFTLIKRDLMIK